MINRIYPFMILIFILIVFHGCDDAWNFDTPGCMDENATNYDFNATFDNESCRYLCSTANNSEECFSFACYWWENECYDTENYTINASSFDDWIYFSFELGDVVDILDSSAGNSTDWDIAFKRNHMKTNGGESGIGSGCAIVDNSQSWTYESFSLSEEIPNYECQLDDLIVGNPFTFQGCYNPDNNHAFEDCIKNPALDNWGLFNADYQFNVNDYQFFVRSANGLYVKFWPRNYYDLNGEGGNISMIYQILD